MIDPTTGEETIAGSAFNGGVIKDPNGDTHTDNILAIAFVRSGPTDALLAHD